MRVASTNVARPDISIVVTRDKSTANCRGLSFKALPRLSRISLELSTLIRPSNDRTFAGALESIDSSHDVRRPSGSNLLQVGGPIGIGVPGGKNLDFNNLARRGVTSPNSDDNCGQAVPIDGHVGQIRPPGRLQV